MFQKRRRGAANQIQSPPKTIKPAKDLISTPLSIYLFGGPGDGFGAPGGGFGGFQVSSKSSGKPLLRLLRRKPLKPSPGAPKPSPGPPKPTKKQFLRRTLF